MFKGRRVNPAAIRRTALLTIEGERDDIFAIGQTLAAQDLTPNLRPYIRLTTSSRTLAITGYSAAGAGKTTFTQSFAT